MYNFDRTRQIIREISNAVALILPHMVGSTKENNGRNFRAYGTDMGPLLNVCTLVSDNLG